MSQPTAAQILAFVDRIHQHTLDTPTTWTMSTNVYRKLRRQVKGWQKLPRLHKGMKRSVHRAYRRAGLERPLPFRIAEAP